MVYDGHMSAEHRPMIPKRLLPRHERVYNGDMLESRVAVLEEIARGTRETLVRIERHMTEGFKDVRDKQERDFRIMFGALIAAVLGLAALVARGFHWF